MFATFETGDLTTYPQRLETLLDKQRHAIDRLARQASPTYASLMKPLQDLDEERALFFTPLEHLHSVADAPDVRTAYEACLPLLSAFDSWLYRHRALYDQIASLHSDDPEAARVLNDTVRDFRLAGVDLDAEARERLTQIDRQLSEQSNAFETHLLDATQAHEWILDRPEDVAGMPLADREAARIETPEGIRYRFSLQMPSYTAYMTYGPNRALRRELYQAYTTRAPENGTVIDRLLALREEKARLLGFDHYAHYALQTRDAETVETVESFLEQLLTSARPQAEREMARLKAYALETDGIETLAPWDVAYYSERLKKELYAYDAALTRPYFPLERVVSGLFAWLTEWFGIAFEPIEVPVWHPSVRVWQLTEADRIVGRIYLDLETRPTKHGGAWMHNWESRFVDQAGRTHAPSAFVVANFAAATPTVPSLLRHDDVVTLFHEMGHAIHHLYSRTHERAVSGIHGVAWDAVEFPSQFLEHFAYEATILKRFGFHYQTGEPIPETLLETLHRARNFQAALGILRQVELALFDLQLHQKSYRGDAVHALLERIRERTALLPPPEWNRFEHGFSHIFAGGYAAGYYSYKWAEVFSADAFHASHDPHRGFEADRARTYREHILSRGASSPMRTLYQNWLGHAPRLESLMRLYAIGVSDA